MNDHAPFSPDSSDDEFDARLRDAIARAEPMPPPSERYLQRVRKAVALRIAIVLLVVAIIGGVQLVRSAVETDYRFRRLVPEWLLASPPRATPDAVVVDVVPAPPPPPVPTQIAVPATPASLTKAQVKAPFMANEALFDVCFSSTAPVVLLTFTINEAGKASDITVDADTPLQSPVVECVRRVVSGLQWPAAADTVEVTMRLTPT